MKAMRNEAILDLDDPKSIIPSLYSVIDRPRTWAALREDVKGKCALFHEFANSEESVKTPLVRALRDAAERVIRSEYAAVAVYHACRPKERAAYSADGLLRTNERLLWQLTKDVFGDTPETLAAFVPVCRKYLEWYDGTIGFFLTAHEQTSWHRVGCFIGKMADTLGQNGQALLNAFLVRSIPTIVKCKLPLDWLDSKMRDPSVGHCAFAVLQRMILMRALPEDATNDFGALGLKCDVPPSMIIGFIDPTD